MVLDVVVEFDGEQPSLKGIRGVETVFEGAVVRRPVKDGVRPAIGHGRDAKDTPNMAHHRLAAPHHLLKQQKPLAPKVSPIIAPKVASTHHEDKAKVETKPTRGIKRRSIIDKENEGKLMR